MTGLTTHVLDTFHGQPAAGLGLRLRKDGAVVAEAITSMDGRPHNPLLSGKTLKAGVYRLEFAVGEYFRDLGVALTSPAFLETVIVEFGIADPRIDAHVALLVSPYAYSTHRGG